MIEKLNLWSYIYLFAFASILLMGIDSEFDLLESSLLFVMSLILISVQHGYDAISEKSFVVASVRS